MLYQHHQLNFKSSKHIDGHPYGKRVSRRESRLGQFKIPNPILQNASNLTGNVFMPNLPTGIKNQLANMEYLSYGNVNKIGQNVNSSGPFNVNKRTSRFSKRLYEMQKALQLQDMKMLSLQSDKQEHNFLINEQQGHGQQNIYSSMMDFENNSSLDMLGDNVLDRELDLDCLQMDMCCEQQTQMTEVEYYSQQEIRPEINYEQYESYLNV